MTSLAVTARRLHLQACLVEVTDAFAAAGVECLLLKGEATARLLYRPDEPRLTRDVDLLVRDPARSGQVLARLGFTVAYPAGHAHEASPHAETWTRGQGWERTEVDLHHSFHGVGVPSSELWDLWRQSAEPIDIGGRPLLTPGRLDALLVVALHRSRTTGGAAEQDLDRALQIVGDEQWRLCLDRARQLDCVAVFQTGLSLHPQGRELLDRLSLGHRLTERERLRLAHGDPGAAWLDIVAARSLRRLWEELWPSPPMLQRNHPRASRGRTQRALARAERIAHVARRGLAITSIELLRRLARRSRR